MFTSLKIERIGNDRLGHQPAWVDLVTGIKPHGLIKERIEGHADYSNANSVGSRGVYIYYILQDGNIYHVSSPINFKRRDTYFCRVEQGEIIRMEFQEVIRVLVRRKAQSMPRKQPWQDNPAVNLDA